MRILLALLGIGIIAYIVLTKRRKALRKKIGEVGGRKGESARKKKEDEERAYDTVIDCPVCLGMGEVLRIGNRRKRPDYDELKWKYEYYKEDDLYHYNTCGRDYSTRESEKRIVNFRPGGMNRGAFHFTWLYIGQDPKHSARFCFEITSESRDFFVKSNPRV